MRFVIALGLISCAGSTLAAETKTYTYDALGRLRTTASSGGPANGISTATNYDKADNRTSYIVNGSTKPPPIGRSIVTPLNGLPIIIIPQD